MNKSLNKIFLTKFNMLSVLIFVGVNLLFAFLSYRMGLGRYTLDFAKQNVLQLLIILLSSFGLFYYTFHNSQKKAPNLMISLVYLLGFALITYSLFTLSIIFQFRFNKSLLSSWHLIFVFISLIFTSFIFSYFDIPTIDDLNSYIKSMMENFSQHLGLFIAVAFIISLIGFIQNTIIYLISFLIIAELAFLFKSILSNYRK